jgi:AraC-like DNA-binding protein
MKTPQLTIARCMDDRNLPVALVRDDRGHDSPLHTHEFTEIVVVLDGGGYHRTERSEYPIEPGDAFLIQAGQMHGYRIPERLYVANVLFDEAALQIPINDLRTMPGYHALFTLEPLYRKEHNFETRLRLEPRQLAHVSALIDDFEAEVEAQSPGYVLMTVAQFARIVVYLSRCYAEADAPAVRPLLAVGEVIGHLESNLAESITLGELAKLAHMSESSLLRAFKRATGRSPIDYHLRLRIGRACELLRLDDRSITEIAFDVGFADSNYFTRQFRKTLGLTPRDYRKRFSVP